MRTLPYVEILEANNVFKEKEICKSDSSYVHVNLLNLADDSQEGDSSNKVEVKVEPHRRMRRSLDPILNRMKRSNHGGGGGGGGGVVGPVHTYVRTDYDGNYRWGARHHVGSSYGRGK